MEMIQKPALDIDGQIWDNLLSRWAKLKPDWKFYHVGWQNKDRPYETKEGYWMLPIQNAEFGFDTVLSYCLTYQPDILLTMADIGITAGFIDYAGLNVCEAKKKGWKGRWFAISLIDTEDWEYMLWNKILDFPDINIAGAKNGEIIYTKHNIKNLRYIPMGVDTKVYYPLANKEELKLKYKLSNKFVVGFVGKNQRRKMIPQLIKGFSKFSKGKDDVALLLHTDAFGQFGWDIRCLIAKAEVEEDENIEKLQKILITKPKLDVIMRQNIQPENMNEIYNLMDIFCYSTGGEGFGLPGLECQSCGVPLMMTDCSSAIEIVPEKDLLIPVLKDEYGRKVSEQGPNGVSNLIPNDIKIMEILEKLYLEWKEKKLIERSERARKFALTYDWDLICKKWLDLFENES